MRTKIITIISHTHNALAFEWVAQFLDREKFEQKFILLNDGPSTLEKDLAASNFDVFHINYSGKTDVPKALMKITRILRRERPSIVHTHLSDASLLGLMAAKFVGIKTRVHTRHHSNSNKEYYPGAVKYDLLINKLSTHIVAVSLNVKEYLVNYEKVDAGKIYIIPHGLNFAETENISQSRMQALRDKYNPEKRSPVIGVISRYIHLKGIQFIIPAFKKLLETYPNACLVLANARGNYSTEIKKMLAEIPPQNYTEIDFEEDLFALYNLFDVYVHVPIDKICEAFGQTYVEALACKVPSVFTLSGIANDFIEHKKNAWVVPYKNSDAIYEGIMTLLSDKELCGQMVARGYKDVCDKFTIRHTVNLLEALYTQPVHR
ncbi:MAG TPA: glycosyltransferase family 4 protein [Bacteroidia bacterium]|nr:glycosyltransferase family 4 protein [Bacteroidia bacterium]